MRSLRRRNRVLEFYAEPRNWGRQVAMVVWKAPLPGGAGDRLVAAPLQFVPEPGDDRYCEPTMLLTARQAVEMMDAMWRAGVRPTARALQLDGDDAAKRHLEDMRAIAFAAIEHAGVKAARP